MGFLEMQTASFPRQKISSRKKTRKWAEDCVKSIITQISNYDTGNNIRRSRVSKKVNYDLLAGIINPNDVEETLNPLGMKASYVSLELQDYSKIKSKVDLLVGESIKRPFEVEVRCVNPTAVSEKQEEIKDIVFKEISMMIDPTKNEKFDEQQVEKRLRKLERFAKYEYREMRERTSNHLLRYLMKRLDLDDLFMRGMEDVLAVAEEIYSVDIRSGTLVAEKLSPLNVTCLRMGNSNKIEDSDIIIIDGYYPLGYVIDNFNEYLSETDIKTLESNYIMGENLEGAQFEGTPASFFPQELTEDNSGFSGLVFDTENSFNVGQYADQDGNVRVIRVIWRSLRRVGKLKYYDDAGTELYRYVDEFYTPDEMKGEEITYFWVNEFWQGYRVGRDIFLKLEPLPRVGSNIDNPSRCISPIVGTMLNVDQSKQKSLVDLLKPWEYLHAEVMHRLRKAVNRFRMPSSDVDVAAIPDFLDIDDWIYYDQEVGYRFRDSFKEGNKGVAQGKLAGTFQNFEKLFNPDMRNYIEQHLQLLNYIDQEMGSISGITKQREGQIEQRELVGNVEVARTQSSHITEKLFALHENTKLRFLTTLLEYAKYFYRGKDNIKLSYVTDDMSTEIINFDGKSIADAEFGLFVSNSRNDYKLRNSLENMSQQMFNANMIGLKDLVTILHTPSIVEMKHTLEDSEDRRNEAAAAAEKQKNELLQQEMIRKSEERDKELALLERNNIRDNETKLMLGSLNAEDGVDKLKEMELDLKQQRQKLDEKIANDNKTIKDKQLTETIRHNKETEKISKTKKPSPSSK